MSSGRLFGKDIYAEKSNMCLAGIHGGVITENGGFFRIVYKKKAPKKYKGCTKNGVISSKTTHRGKGFVVERYSGIALVSNNETCFEFVANDFVSLSITTEDNDDVPTEFIDSTYWRADIYPKFRDIILFNFKYREDSEDITLSVPVNTTGFFESFGDWELIQSSKYSGLANDRDALLDGWYTTGCATHSDGNSFIAARFPSTTFVKQLEIGPLQCSSWSVSYSNGAILEISRDLVNYTKIRDINGLTIEKTRIIPINAALVEIRLTKKGYLSCGTFILT
eukprot:TRINITY_DN3230_c1_g1_i1.p1 TRINITY_DN3230_c1_g1~~TRINITY_DN3230_c1_g1_i1.p1  ORF type:complete len:280 (-),score=59.06 TRINITY_DN3230_c1_g1_i1:386-1225(-)